MYTKSAKRSPSPVYLKSIPWCAYPVEIQQQRWHMYYHLLKGKSQIMFHNFIYGWKISVVGFEYTSNIVCTTRKKIWNTFFFKKRFVMRSKRDDWVLFIIISYLFSYHCVWFFAVAMVKHVLWLFFAVVVVFFFV